MIYNIYIGESRGLGAVEALERAKADTMNQTQIGFVKGVVQNALNNSLTSFRLF